MSICEDPWRSSSSWDMAPRQTCSVGYEHAKRALGPNSLYQTLWSQIAWTSYFGLWFTFSFTFSIILWSFGCFWLGCRFPPRVPVIVCAMNVMLGMVTKLGHLYKTRILSPSTGCPRFEIWCQLFDGRISCFWRQRGISIFTTDCTEVSAAAAVVRFWST